MGIVFLILGTMSSISLLVLEIKRGHPWWHMALFVILSFYGAAVIVRMIDWLANFWEKL